MTERPTSASTRVTAQKGGSSVVTEGIGFFKNATLEDFPEEDVFELDASLSTLDAYEALVKHGFHSAPVKDKGSKRVGFLDTADMVSYVVNALHRTSAPDVDAPPEDVSVKDLILWVNRHVPDSADLTVNLSSRHLFRSVPANATVLDVLELMGEKNVKRVAVMDVLTHRITKMITQSSLSTWMAKHASAFEPLGQATVGSTRLGYIDEMYTISLTSPGVKAFEEMDKYSVSAMPVVDRKTKKLVGVISDTDLRALVTVKNFKIYGLNTEEMLKQIKGDAAFDVVTVTPATKIVDIFALLQEHKIHRVYITEKDVLLGVITFKELLQFLLSKSQKAKIQWSK